jgi:hypothetical protein
MSNDEVVNQLQISHGFASEIIHQRLHFQKVCARCVPKQLMEQHRHNPLDRCKCSYWYHEESDTFVSHTVTVNKTWIYHYKAIQQM